MNHRTFLPLLTLASVLACSCSTPGGSSPEVLLGTVVMPATLPAPQQPDVPVRTAKADATDTTAAQWDADRPIVPQLFVGSARTKGTFLRHVYPPKAPSPGMQGQGPLITGC